MTLPVYEPPRSILLATDLTARCDRALDRSLQLAARWEARLTVLHALERSITRGLTTAELEQVTKRARTLVASDIASARVENTGLSATGIVVREGKADRLIADCAEEIAADLVVMGPSHTDWLGQTSGGSTVTSLAIGIERPLLIVKQRGRRPYELVLAATDMVDRNAVETVAHWFPKARTTVFSAYTLPFANLADDREGYDAGVARKVEADLRDHIATLSLSPDFNPNIRVAAGDPARRIAELAAGQQIDLVVTATSGRSGLARFVLGSVAQEILDSVPADVLIVPEAPSVGVPSR